MKNKFKGWTVEENNNAWSSGDYRVLAAEKNGARVIIAQGDDDTTQLIAKAPELLTRALIALREFEIMPDLQKQIAEIIEN